MFRAMIGLSVVALATAACGPKQLALPSDPIDRAATCAVISAADSRAHTTSMKGDLDFDSQTRIIHYAMMAASDGGKFSTTTASAVVDRMKAVEADVTNSKWQPLVAPCDQSYPLAKKTSGIELPSARFDAALGCYALSDFLAKTVTTNDPAAQETLSGLMKMRRDLDATVGSGLKARGAGKYENTLSMKQDALARMTQLGAPAETLKLCATRFS